MVKWANVSKRASVKITNVEQRTDIILVFSSICVAVNTDYFKCLSEIDAHYTTLGYKDCSNRLENYAR